MNALTVMGTRTVTYIGDPRRSTPAIDRSTAIAEMVRASADATFARFVTARLAALQAERDAHPCTPDVLHHMGRSFYFEWLRANAYMWSSLGAQPPRKAPTAGERKATIFGCGDVRKDIASGAGLVAFFRSRARTAGDSFTGL